MEPTLLVGDGIIIDKISYGPRIDLKSLVSFVTTQFGPRLPGISKIKRGDVLVFNSPTSHTDDVVKRCVALPGDTIQLRNSIIFINGKQINFPAIFNYRVTTHDTIQLKKTFKDYSIEAGESIILQGHQTVYDIVISDSVAHLLKNKSYVDSIVKIKASEREKSIFPMGLQKGWHSYNYGPLVIPRKGLTIDLNKDAVFTYNSVLTLEQKQLKFDENYSAYLRGKEIKRYTFKNDYYFMMGDNRDHSFDSRWFGFVQDDLIVGKAIAIVYSKDHLKNKMRFSRLFKSIK